MQNRHTLGRLRRYTRVAIPVLVLSGMLFGLASSTRTMIIHVDDDAPLNGDGLSWNTPYKYLQDALADATTGVEIRVAGGVYTPDQDEGGLVTPGLRTESFHLISGVAVYGGYAGLANPQDPDERDIAAYETTLSGDLLGDDGPEFTGYGDNSFHVVVGNGLADTTVLDGLTVRGGNAEGVRNGGGIRLDSSSPQITNCVIAESRARDGGGIWCIDHCDVVVRGTTIAGNHADRQGGGVVVEITSDPEFVDCVIERNTAVERGAGLFFYEHCTPVIRTSRISRNTVSTFTGGGIYCYDNVSLTLQNCIVSSNTSELEGGGMYFSRSSPMVIGCTFWGNSASNGAALASNYPLYPSSLQVRNCILWNGGDEIWNNDGSTVTVAYSNIQGGWSGSGGNNIDEEPLIMLDGTHLQAGSPCLDSGDPGGNYTGQEDIDGEERVVNGAVDMGADEFLDTDDDGLPDLWEQQYFGTPTIANAEDDDNGDGWTNTTAQSHFQHKSVFVPLRCPFLVVS